MRFSAASLILLLAAACGPGVESVNLEVAVEEGTTTDSLSVPPASPDPLWTKWWKTRGGSPELPWLGAVLVSEAGDVFGVGVSPLGERHIRLVRYNGQGRQIWYQQLPWLGGSVKSSLALDGRGAIYVATAGALSKLDVATGKLHWSKQLGMSHALVAGPDGSVTVASDPGRHCAYVRCPPGVLEHFGADGALQWRRQNGTVSSFDVYAGLVTDAHGHIYTYERGTLLKLAPDGTALAATPHPYVWDLVRVGDALWGWVSVYHPHQPIPWGASQLSASTFPSTYVYVTGLDGTPRFGLMLEGQVSFSSHTSGSEVIATQDLQRGPCKDLLVRELTSSGAERSRTLFPRLQCEGRSDFTALSPVVSVSTRSIVITTPFNHRIDLGEGPFWPIADDQLLLNLRR